MKMVVEFNDFFITRFFTNYTNEYIVLSIRIIRKNSCPLISKVSKIKKLPTGALCVKCNFSISLFTIHYSASATTSFTSGIIRFIIPSIPAFNVIIDEGQPEQEPCNIKFTVPSL